MNKTFILTIVFVLGLNNLYSQNNNALNFDGSNDYAQVTLPPIFSGDITIEGWIFPESSTFSRVFFAQSSSSNFISITYANNNSIIFYVNNTISAQTDAGTFPINQWNHFAVTRNFIGNSIQIYLNGILQSTNSAGSSSVGTDNIMTIGSRTNLAQFFKGNIDELRIWNGIRTQSEISSNMNTELVLPQTNLQIYYKFNQGVANSNNAGITTLNDELNVYNGSLNNFTLNGLSSNWVGSTSLSTSDYNFNSKKVSLFPNPANDFIQISGLSNDENCKIFNQLGIEILNQKVSNLQKIDIHNLQNGVYCIKFENRNSIKFIKN